MMDSTPHIKVTVEQMAALAKLSFSPEEEQAMQAELDAMLALAHTLQPLDITPVSGVSPDYASENRLREDIPSVPFARDVMLANAPVHTEECILVPKAMDQEGE